LILKIDPSNEVQKLVVTNVGSSFEAPTESLQVHDNQVLETELKSLQAQLRDANLEIARLKCLNLENMNSNVNVELFGEYSSAIRTPPIPSNPEENQANLSDFHVPGSFPESDPPERPSTLSEADYSSAGPLEYSAVLTYAPGILPINSAANNNHGALHQQVDELNSQLEEERSRRYSIEEQLHQASTDKYMLSLEIDDARARINYLEERLRIQEPLVETAAATRNRFFEALKTHFVNGNPVNLYGVVPNRTIKDKGNEAVHAGNWRVDSTLEKMGKLSPANRSLFPRVYGDLPTAPDLCARMIECRGMHATMAACLAWTPHTYDRSGQQVFSNAENELKAIWGRLELQYPGNQDRCIAEFNATPRVDQLLINMRRILAGIEDKHRRSLRPKHKDLFHSGRSLTMICLNWLVFGHGMRYLGKSLVNF
jgi:hypothetical protein